MEYLLLFGAESFVFQVAIQKYRDNYNFGAGILHLNFSTPCR